MSTETTKKKIKIDNGTEFARVYTDKEMDSKLSGLSSDTAIITLSDAQVQSLSQFEITFTQEQATLLENATSFKFYYAGTEIAHGQCGKIIQGNQFAYGLSMRLGNATYSGINQDYSAINDYKQLIQLKPYREPEDFLIDFYFNSNTNYEWIEFKYNHRGTELKKTIYFDTINNNTIFHNDSTSVKNYDLGKSINLFGNHSILVPNASSDTEINLYNHFIKITGNASEVEPGVNIVARFTIQSSNNLVVDTPEKLATLLGNEFELGCNGIYGNYSITGLRKTADGTLNIIYNNGGAESLQSVASLTISISDKVKTV